MSLATKSALLVGVGGLGSPAARVLARSGVGRLVLLDDDVVDVTNLHRQVLFDDSDVGAPKVEVAARVLREDAAEAGHSLVVDVVNDRLTPENGLACVAGFDVVVEGADNLGTKFLAVDACRLARVPVVQAGAVRWQGWALATLPEGGACLRCVFEDIPDDRVETCAEAGIVGPVVGVLGAIEAALALRILAGDASVAGELFAYDGLAGTLRKTRVSRRDSCPLCGGSFADLSRSRYAAPCAA